MHRSVILVFLAFFAAATAFATGASEAKAPIRIGVLTDVDSLPFLVADAQGFFSEAGVNVETVLFQNPVERDAAFQAGQVDGIVADLIGAILSNAAGADSVITSITSGRYGLAAAPQSGASTLPDLTGREIGISSNTVIEYVASALLERAGVPPDGFVPLAVPKIPVRMELLLNGQLPAACLPEPLYSLVVDRGATPLGDSTSLADDLGVMLFTRSIVAGRASELALAYRAYWRACEAVNERPDAFRDFLVDTMGFAPEIRNDFSFVTYEFPRLPSATSINDVATWMVARGLVSEPPAYARLCDASVIDEIANR